MPTYPFTTSAQVGCLAVVVGSPIVGGIFLGLRLYARWLRQTKLSWDDYLIVVAWIFTIAVVPPTWMYVKWYHLGFHYWQIDPNYPGPDYREMFKVLVSFNLINTPIPPIAKASIIALLLRLGSFKRSIKYILWGLQTFNALFIIVPWIWMIFECPPISNDAWMSRISGNIHCISRNRIGDVQLVQNCANLVTDLLIFPLPFVIIGVNMMSATRWKRFKIISVFFFILGGTACTILKIYWSQSSRRQAGNQDWMYTTISMSINHIENTTAIVIANLPAIRGIFTTFKPTSLVRSNVEAGLSTEQNVSKPRTFSKSLQSWRLNNTYENYGSQVDLRVMNGAPISERSSGVEEVELAQIPGARPT